jgi:hypothetical protein
MGSESEENKAITELDGAEWMGRNGRMQRLWEVFKGKRDARILVPLNKKYLDHSRSRDPISRAIRVENLL